MSDATTSGRGPYENIWYSTQITDTNHAGWLWIAGLLSLIYPLFSFVAHLNVRMKNLDVDDWILMGSNIASFAEHAALFVALSRGLGKASAVLQDSSVDAPLVAANVLFVVAHTAAKASVAIFVRRLFNSGARTNTVLCNGLIGSTIVWGVFALLAMFVDCSFSKFATNHAECPAESLRWWLVGAFDSITEIGLIAVPSILVSGIKINMRAKTLVFSAFVCRLPLVAFTLVHAQRIIQSHAATNKALSYISVIIWLQVTLAWSLMSASIPTFKTFMQPFDAIGENKQFSNGLRSELNGAYLMMGREKPKGSSQGKSANTAHSSALGRIRGDRVDAQATIGTMHRGSVVGVLDDDSASQHSQADIIRKVVQWEITRDSCKDV